MFFDNNKRKSLQIRRTKPPRQPRGITTLVDYGNLVRQLMEKLPSAVASMLEANEAYMQQLKQVIQHCTIGSKGDSALALTVPDTRGELYYIEKRLRLERELRVTFLLNDFQTIMLFCKQFIPPGREMVIKAKTKRVSSLQEVIGELPSRLKRGKEMYSVKASELQAKHEEQMRRHRKCTETMRKLLSKENNYVNLVQITDGGLKTVHQRGRTLLGMTTPDLSKELRRTVDRHIQIYMQQRQLGIIPNESSLSKADEKNRTQYVPGKSSKLDEIRWTMEQLAARVVPPGIQIKELNNMILMRAERIAKVDQMKKSSRQDFHDLVECTRTEKNVAKNAKTLLAAVATHLVGVIQELIPKVKESKEMREVITQKLNYLSEHAKLRKEECKPHKKKIKRYTPQITSLRQEIVVLSQVEAQLRYKLKMLLDHLAEVEKQKSSASSSMQIQEESAPVNEEEVRLHHDAMEKVELRISCLETDREVKDLQDLINRKRCHIKLQLDHLNKELSYIEDETDSRNSSHDLFASDNARLEKYVLDNQEFLKKVSEAIEKFTSNERDPGGELKKINSLERECDHIQIEIEKLILAPEEYYPKIREIEREIDAIRSRCREKTRSLHKIESSLAREREMRKEMKITRAVPDQLPNLIEKDLQAVAEEIKTLQAKFEEVFTKNIDLKSKMIEVESALDGYRRNLARLETDVAMKEMELDKYKCRGTAKQRADVFYKKYKLERHSKFTSTPPPPPPPPPRIEHYSPPPPIPPEPQEPPPQPKIEGPGPSHTHECAEMYIEEVNVQTTRTIRATAGFLGAHGMPSPSSGDGSGAFLHEEAARAAGAGKSSTSEGGSRTPHPAGSPPTTSKEEHLRLLLTETKVPAKSMIGQVNDEDSPEAQWVSYTDGRDIPTVLKSSLDQESTKTYQKVTTSKTITQKVETGKAGSSTDSKPAASKPTTSQPGDQKKPGSDSSSQSKQ